MKVQHQKVRDISYEILNILYYYQYFLSCLSTESENWFSVRSNIHYEGHSSNNKALHFALLCSTRIRMSEGSRVLINISTILWLKGNIGFLEAITREKVPHFLVQQALGGTESYINWWFFENELKEMFVANHFSAWGKNKLFLKFWMPCLDQNIYPGKSDSWQLNISDYHNPLILALFLQPVSHIKAGSQGVRCLFQGRVTRSVLLVLFIGGRYDEIPKGRKSHPLILTLCHIFALCFSPFGLCSALRATS